MVNDSTDILAPCLGKCFPDFPFLCPSPGTKAIQKCRCWKTQKCV